MSARLSVVIPCYNQGHFLHEAIASVLGSTLADAEVVVVNDGSTDDTLAVARSHGSRVLVVDQANQGLPAARNAGFAAATGNLLLFLDADDRIHPEFLARMVEAAAREPGAAVFCGEWDWVDAAGRLLGNGRVEFPADAYRFLLGGNRMPCHAVVVRRAALAGPAPFDPSLAALEDWDLWLRLARAGRRFVAVPGARVDYRRHAGSMSRDLGRMLRAAREVLRRHRGQHLLARLRGMRAIRYGLFCENVLPACRATGSAALCWLLLRQPEWLGSALLWSLFALCPRLRRWLRVSERPFAAVQAPRPGDAA